MKEPKKRREKGVKLLKRERDNSNGKMQEKRRTNKDMKFGKRVRQNGKEKCMKDTRK